MAHPHFDGLSETGKQVLIVINVKPGQAVLPTLGPADHPAEKMADDLKSVADAENRNAHVEKGLVRQWRARRVYAGRSAGKDQPFGAHLMEGFIGDGVRHDFAIHMMFADSARDQLGILGAEIEDEDFFFGRVGRHRMSVRSRFQLFKVSKNG